MHAGRHRKDRWPWADAAIGTIGPTMGFNDVADHPGPDKFAQPVIALFAMPLVAHLRRRFGFFLHCPLFNAPRNVIVPLPFIINRFSLGERRHRIPGYGWMCVAHHTICTALYP